MRCKPNSSKRGWLVATKIFLEILVVVLMVYGMAGGSWVTFSALVTTAEKRQTISFQIGLWTSQGCLPDPKPYNKHCQNGTLTEILNVLEEKGEIPRTDLAERVKLKYLLALQVMTNPAWILCIVNSLFLIILTYKPTKHLKLASIVVAVFAVTFCLTVFGLGIQQNKDFSAEMDKFNSESKDIIVEMEVPATVAVVGVGAFLETMISIIWIIYLVHRLFKDDDMWKSRPAIECTLQSRVVTAVEMNHAVATQVPEPPPDYTNALTTRVPETLSYSVTLREPEPTSYDTNAVTTRVSEPPPNYAKAITSLVLDPPPYEIYAVTSRVPEPPPYNTIITDVGPLTQL